MDGALSDLLANALAGSGGTVSPGGAE